MVGLWLAKTGEANAWYHIYPFALSRNLDSLHVIRYKKPLRNIPNVEYHIYNSAGLILDVLKMFFKGVNVVKKEKVDFLITFNPVPWGTIAWLVAKLTKRPLVLGFIGTDFNYYLRKSIFKSFLKKVITSSDIITIPGSHMLAYLLSIGVEKERIFIYPHGVPNEWQDNQNLSFDQKEYDIISIGDLTENKNIIHILKAIKVLKDENIKVNYCIVGDGPERDRINNFVNENDLIDRVYVLGYKNNVKPFLEKSKIYVQASLNEGLSLGLIEAMSLGVVPIVTLAGSEKDYIQHGINGLIYSLIDVNQLVKEIKFAINPVNYVKMKNNLLKSREKYSIDNTIKVVDKILIKLKNQSK